MPLYEFKNTETGEVFEKKLSLSEYDEYINSNPTIQRYYSSGSAPELVSGVKSTMRLAGSEWNDHLKRIKKSSGRNNTINV